MVIWFTGLPQSGKSTLAARVRESVTPRRACALLDSDEVRDALGADRYGATDRDQFYRALGGIAALLARQGQLVLVAATAPLRRYRAAARELAPRFIEVWVRTALAECEQRDRKGLYARARAGDAPSLPGIGVAYEPPSAPDVVADGGRDDEALATIARLIG
jgi:adenylylsulfate kinase